MTIAMTKIEADTLPASDAGSDVFRDGAFVADDWTILADDAEIPSEGRAFLPLARFLETVDSLEGDNRPVGVVLQPGERTDALAPYLDRVAAIALVFPKFGDGRAYSHANLLRDKYGYQGALRAVGDVLIDQIGPMRRVGFSEFKVVNEPTRKALAEGHDPEVKLYYQPAARKEPPAGTRPWMRKAPD